MGFKEHNKYFLRQRFTFEFHQSSIDEKSTLYTSFREEFLKRTTQYYNTISESTPLVKGEFYAELIELIWDYDKNYILTNLLFETNFNSIIIYLNKNKNVFETRLMSDGHPNSGLEFIFKKFLDETDVYFSSTLKDLLNEHLKTITNVSPSHWEIIRNTNTGSIKAEVIHVYTEYLISNLSQKDHLEEIILIHFLFTKAWHLNFKFEEKNEITIVILFLNQLIKFYRQKITQGKIPILHHFILSLKRKHNEIFARGFEKTPLFDVEKEKEYPKGYFAKRDELDQLILNNEFLHDSSTSELEYHELFTIYINSKSSLEIKKKIKKVIREKIDAFIVPTSNEVSIMEQSCDDNGRELLNELYKCFYLFERLI